MHEFISKWYEYFSLFKKIIFDEYWKTILKTESHFTISISAEIKTLCSFIDSIFEIIHDYAFDMFIASEPNVQNILHDIRLQNICETVIWGRTIADWCETPLVELTKYFATHIILPFQFLGKILSSRIEVVFQNLTTCSTVDELIRLCRNEHIIDSTIPIEKIVTHFKLQSIWVARDVYYEAC